MDAAVAMARNAVKLKFSDTPPEAVEATKKDILDTLGTTVAGSAAAGGREIVEMMKEFGGKEESTVVVYGGKVPVVNTAMTNGSMWHHKVIEVNDALLACVQGVQAIAGEHD